MEVLESFMEQKQRAPQNARELIMFASHHTFFDITLDNANQLLVWNFFIFYFFFFFFVQFLQTFNLLNLNLQK